MPTPVDVTFADTAFASREWSAWAVPRVSSAVLAPTGAQQAPGIDAFDDVWLALWSFTAGQWTVDPILPMARYSNPVAKQIDVILAKQ